MKSILKSVLILTAMGAANAHAADMVLANPGGAGGVAQQKAYIDPFQKATGKQVLVVPDSDGMGMAKVKAMVEARRVTWDVVQVESGDIDRACAEGYFEKIDFKKVGNPNDFLPDALHECGVGILVWSFVMAYNADRVKPAPTRWRDFWDVRKYPGKRALRKGARFNLEFALMADGVAPKDVYQVLATPAGVARAFGKLDELKNHIQWWEAGAQPPQFLVAGDVVMASAYNGRIDAAQKEGRTNLQISWNGSIYDIDYWAIPKGSPRREIAERYIAFASRPDRQLALSQLLAYGPVNKEALRLMDAPLLATMPNSPANSRNALRGSLRFWSDHGDDLEQRFAAWAAK